MPAANLYRLQSTLKTDSMIPADYVTNTAYFTFDGGGTPSSEQLDGPAAIMRTMYNILWANNVMSAALQMGGHDWSLYKMSDPLPRVPVKEGVYATFSGSPSVAAPAELSMVLSFHGDLTVSGVNKARRRGRFYIGPLGFLGGEPIGSNQVGYVHAAGNAMLLASSSNTDWTWVVYSPTGDTSTPVVGGWVDNAYDVQRRRGLKATSRTVFPS